MNGMLYLVAGAAFGAITTAVLLADSEDESRLEAGLQGLSEDDRDSVVAAMQLEKRRQLAEF